MTSPGERIKGLQQGFTLLELIIALVILGLAVSLIVRQPPGSRALEARRLTTGVADSLREARSKAIAENRVERVTVDLAQHSIKLEGDVPRTLPPSTKMSLLTAAGEVSSRTRGDIVFEPDGSSTGGRIVLDDGAGRRRAITVDWLTGRVSVGDAPR